MVQYKKKKLKNGVKLYIDKYDAPQPVDESTQRLFENEKPRIKHIHTIKLPKAIELRSDATLDIWNPKMLAYYKGITKKKALQMEKEGRIIRCIFYHDGADGYKPKISGYRFYIFKEDIDHIAAHTKKQLGDIVKETRRQYVHYIKMLRTRLHEEDQ